MKDIRRCRTKVELLAWVKHWEDGLGLQPDQTTYDDVEQSYEVARQRWGRSEEAQTRVLIEEITGERLPVVRDGQHR